MLVLVNNSLGERMRAYTLPFGLLAALAASVSSAQPLSARALLEQAAEAMGGLDRLQALDNVVLTGFGVYLNQQGGGNLSSDPRAPAKWQAANDAQRTFDLKNERALNQDRRGYMFPFAATSGHAWNRGNQVQTGVALLDHRSRHCSRRSTRRRSSAR